MKTTLYRVIGLMSGTSIDGIDAALVETDGLNHVRSLAFMPHPYEISFRKKLRSFLGNTAGIRQDPDVANFERELTELHAGIVGEFREQFNGLVTGVDLIGFHGQTIWHQPKKRATIQIGDGALLAKMTNIPVVNDFRTADVLAGGNGAPLVPLYHRALAAKLPKPVAVLNIGGVSNVTWIGGERDEDIVAYDVGPGNALIDDWVLHHTGQAYDEYGLLAGSGQPDMKIVEQVLAKPFFKKKPPKSIDRNMFKNFMPEGLSQADGAATLTMVTARAMAAGMKFIPEKPKCLYVAGGGRLNHTLMRWIAELCDRYVGQPGRGSGLERRRAGSRSLRLSRRALALRITAQRSRAPPAFRSRLRAGSFDRGHPDRAKASK